MQENQENQENQEKQEMQGQKMQEKQEEAKQMQVVYRKFEQNSSIKFVRKNKLNSPFL